METEIYIVQAVNIKPGDVLILATRDNPTPEQLKRIRERLAEYLDPMAVAFCIIAGASIFHLTKEEVLREYHNQKGSS